MAIKKEITITTKNPMATVTKKSIDESPDKGIIIQNITVRPVVRKSQDIESWRNAIKSAEAIHPTYVLLYDLYEEIMLDAVLVNLVKKKILGVTKTKMLYVDKDGKEVEAMTELLKTRQFRKLRKEVAKQQIFGPTVIELINDAKGFRIYPVKRKHIRPKEGLVVYEQYGYDGINYRVPPASNYVLEVGDWDDFGLMMVAAQYVIYKRGGFGDWAAFAEIFGMPFREAKYDGFNEVTRQQLVQAMEAAGSAQYMITPKDSEFKLHESKNTQSSGELYNALRKACNEELSILFLGQTETTSKTAGKLGGNDDTHEQTEDDINTDDKADELSIFNENVKPILYNLGLLPVDGSFVYEEQEEDIPLPDKIDNIIRLRNEAKLPIDDDYLYETTGIPKPANYDVQKQQLEDAANNGANEPANSKPGKVGDKKGTQKENNNTKEKLAWLDRFRLSLADFFDPAHES